jgi:hypothetical protein
MICRHRQTGLAAIWWLVGILAAAALLLAGYVWIMLSWSYSSGERAGWVQKLSRKGYICKTWEGEMVMVSMPGAIPEKFLFTAWDETIAEEINQVMGKRVSLYYEEHIGLPTTCFGDTGHFVKRVKVLEDMPAVPIAPGAARLLPPGSLLQPQPDDVRQPVRQPSSEPTKP